LDVHGSFPQFGGVLNKIEKGFPINILESTLMPVKRAQIFTTTMPCHKMELQQYDG
jgi:hypothetical protein